ncbi:MULTISPECIES: hypothetical protein [Brucella]|uniref:hypothetical protein n=1 Tax=Brucella tritici TaxID=94626 RepID=UPI002001B436|nr:hypothetical protein [Brucella tritici]
MSTKLLEEIEAFMAETGTGAFRFGMKAIKNGRLVERLRSGGRVWPETEMEVRAYIRAERANANIQASRQRKEVRASI